MVNFRARIAKPSPKHLEHFSDVWVCHIYREANAAADFMAKLGSSAVMGFVLYEESPPGISSILFNDCIGTVFPRTSVAAQLLYINLYLSQKKKKKNRPKTSIPPNTTTSAEVTACTKIKTRCAIPLAQLYYMIKVRNFQ